jgi:RNA polymerase sigma-70 factor (ECF subfamily)
MLTSRAHALPALTSPPSRDVPHRAAGEAGGQVIHEPATIEQALVARAQAGDTAAFEALYRREAGRTFAVCLRLTGDRSRAAELTQDVFVRAWERLDAFRGDCALSTWLHRLAVNALLSGARADRRREARVASAEDVDAATPTDAAPLHAPDLEGDIDMERAIAALPPGARTVFVLHDVHGYRHGEIARMTGSAEGTCKAQLHRARRLLREALDR